MGLDREPEEGAWGVLDPLYGEAATFVIESQRASISAVQRKLKIGYNRAARLIEALEEGGIVTAMNSNGSRDVLVQTPPSVVVDEEQPPSAPTSPLSGESFGGHTIDDITVMVLRKDSIDLPWLQSRFALDSEQVNSVAIQLLDANVIALETEGAPQTRTFTASPPPARTKHWLADNQLPRPRKAAL